MSGEPRRRQVTPEQFAQLTRRRLLLFLSVDMEGSTRLKQTISNRQAQVWLDVVLRFIEEFPQAFQAKRDEHARKQRRAVPAPRLWKMLGDELVFWVEPERLHDVAALVETFRAALETLNTRTREERSGAVFPLVKGAAWVAGFPVTNAVVRMEDDSEDFVGPSMDAGFRIAKFANSRRFAVSVELAWLLSHEEGRSNVTLHFEGCADLKGVAEESGYPAIWIETSPSDFKRLEDDLLGRSAQGSTKKVHQLCDAFIKEYGVPDHTPFLPTDLSTTAIPSGYEGRYELAMHALRSLYIVDDPSAKATMRDKRQAKKQAEKLRTRLKNPPSR